MTVDVDTSNEALLLAALRVVGSLSESNYRTLRQPGRLSNPTVPRSAMIELADAIEQVRPGVIARMHELARQAKPS